LEKVEFGLAIRDLPNVMLVHFPRLKADMPCEIGRIAAFLDISVDESKWPSILEHCSFDYMKTHAAPSVPLGGAFWNGGAETFINQGTNGRWRDTLSQQQSAAYEKRAIAELGVRLVQDGWSSGTPHGPLLARSCLSTLPLGAAT
jgi:aryl sulfotransferase